MTKCPMCDNELIGKQKYCSAGCRKKASRLGSAFVRTLTQEKKKKILETQEGHWFGKQPHTPIWIECDENPEDCIYNHAEEINWIPTCTKPCCA